MPERVFSTKETYRAMFNLPSAFEKCSSIWRFLNILETSQNAKIRRQGDGTHVR